MKLSELNAGKASLIILKILLQQGSLDQQTLFAEAKKAGVGKTAFDSSIEVCAELELIEMKPKKVHPTGQPALIHILTSQGEAIAEKIVDIERLLEGGT